MSGASQNKDIRWIQRFDNFKRAFARLAGAATLQHRNQTSHTYDQKIAAAIVQAILERYVPEFEVFQSAFLDFERKENA